MICLGHGMGVQIGVHNIAIFANLQEDQLLAFKNKPQGIKNGFIHLQALLTPTVPGKEPASSRFCSDCPWTADRLTRDQAIQMIHQSS
jgi:hypothetical protein